MENRNEMQPYISGLPSVEQAYDNYENVTSDHLPILATIPFEDSNLEEIKVISWNVLEDDNGNGFAPNGEKDYKESDSQRGARHLRIANSLAKFVGNYQPDFIALQEIHAKGSLCNLISERLNDYGCTDDQGCITLYRVDKYEYVSSINNYKAGGHIAKFKLKNDDNYEIRFSNVHCGFTEYTLEQESLIEQFLTGRDAFNPPVDKNKTLAIWAGDQNGTVLDLDNHQHKIITSVSPSFFRKNVLVEEAQKAKLQTQGAWSIDGCWHSFRQPNSENVTCKQTRSHLLNPLTTKLHSKDELMPTSWQEMPLFQQQEVNIFRLAISVGEIFTNEREINGHKHSISKYEQGLQILFEDTTLPSIKVRWTVNLNNEMGIGIESKKFYNYFSRLNNPAFQFNIKDGLSDTMPHYIVYANGNNISPLINEIKQNKNLIDLSDAIRSFEKPSTWKQHPEKQKEILDKFNLFFNDVVNQSKRNNQPYPILINNLTNFAKELAENGPMNLERVQAIADNLDTELEGKPPMKMSTKVIIAGIIGAVVGIIVGATVGAALTWYTGGFGAIPGMFVGMSKGFTTATAIVLGTTGVGALVSGGVGYNNAEKRRAYSDTVKRFFAKPKIFTNDPPEDPAPGPSSSLNPSSSTT